MVNRVDILQPETFTHFHWITTTGSDPGATKVPAACDKNNAGQLEDQAPTAVDKTCPGGFKKIKAIKNLSLTMVAKLCR